MEDLDAVLAQLRDIHPPSPVSWWPPAPGWWLTALLVVMLIIFARWWWRRQRSSPLKRQATRELAQLRHDFLQHSNRLGMLSSFARRLAIAQADNPSTVAALTGQAWLAYLDRQIGGDDFSRGVGRVLADGPYQPACEHDAEAVFRLMERWVSNLK